MAPIPWLIQQQFFLTSFKITVNLVITTQCLLEGGDLTLYEVGQKAMKNPVIPAYDMTTEAAVTKLMWVLGQETDFNEIKKMFLSPVNNDLSLDDPSQDLLIYTS